MIEDRLSPSSIIDLQSSPLESFGLLMGRVLTAKTTELFELQTLRRFLLVFGSDVVAIFAIATLQYDIVSHNFFHVRQTSVCRTSDYSTMSEMVPAPTVRPPSRIANLKPFSIAIGVISSISIAMLSPGITISTPSGRCATPVTSVVRK